MKMATVSLIAGLVASVSSVPLSAQVRSSSSADSNSTLDLARALNIGGMRTDRRVEDRIERARECRDEFRRLQYRRVELERRLEQQHASWHRAHRNTNTRNWVRQHNELHERLERQYDYFERSQRAQLARCNDEWDNEHDWNDYRYRDQDRWDNPGRNRSRDDREDWRYDNRRNERDDDRR